MEKEMKARIVHKHDVEENWLKANGFIPKQGEIIVYDEDSNYPYERIKIGDGINNVNILPFAHGASIVVQNKAPTDTSVIWVDSDDDYTDEINITQVVPEFANSIEECTDTTKLYVLPDGFIYAYTLVEKEVETGGGYTNLIDGTNGFIKEGYRYSKSSQAWKEYTATENFASIVIPIPTSGTITTRVRGMDYNGVYPSIYGGSTNTAFSDEFGTAATNTHDENGDWCFTFTNSTGASYFVTAGVLTDDAANVIATVNELIVEGGTEIITEYAWVSTGHAFVPADYEDRIIELETKVEELENALDNAVVTADSDLNKNTCSIFRKVVCCGDSFTAGFINIGNGATVTNEDYAWPSFLARLTGNEYINCGSSGATVLNWLTAERGLPKAKTEGVAQAYIVGLGYNDHSMVTLGTTADIGTENQTYYAGMSRIVRELNAISPKAKIFLLTIPVTYYEPTNQAVRNIVDAYKDIYPVHLLDLYPYKALYSVPSIADDGIGGHYTAIGYQQWAENMRVVWSDYINSHISDFQDVYQLPYD